MLVSPENFGVVEPGIYRCSKIEVENFQFLETLTLKSIVVLDAEKPPRSISNFLDTNKIDLYNLGDLKISNHQHTGVSSKTDLEDYELNNNSGNNNNNSSEVVSNSSSRTSSQFVDHAHAQVVPALVPLLSRSNRDQWMLIEKNLIVKSFELLFNSRRHPILIIDSTATLMGILRKIQKWNFNSILNEYRIFNGTSNKNNYFAETFLELISIELVPYENRKRSPFGSRRNSAARSMKYSNSSSGQEKLQQLQKSPVIYATDLSRSDDLGTGADYEEEAIADEEEDGEDDDGDDEDDDEDDGYDSLDDMDDMDDDLLSASPQIPENLLKFVEQRKLDKQQQSQSQSQTQPNSGRNSIDNDFENGYNSPRSMRSPIMGPSSRNNSITESYLNLVRGMDRRRSSSGEIMRNIKFRNPAAKEGGTSPATLRRKSSAKGISTFLGGSGGSDENSAVAKPVDFKYYKNLHKHRTEFENVGTIKLKLPAEHKLPGWFIKGRDVWEKNYKLLNSDTI
ncbi:uncharacterized protein LODBEIA_P04200 [Lodderomyces beijingensis]|uniref:Protein OCA4 n=1 Tax=Lodderomyces beijingensis TaxID=1775926 RepID=A0ABP0ZH84_9ASCO